MKLADASIQIGEERLETLAGDRHHLGNEETGKNTVFVGDMAAHGQAGTFFAANEDAVLTDIFADKLEADRRFENLGAVITGDGIDKVGGGDRPGGIAALPLDAQQVIVQKGKDIVRLDKGAVGIDDAVTIGVAIRRQAEGDIVPPANQGDEVGNILFRRFRGEAAKVRIGMSVDHDRTDPGFLQKAIEITAPGAVKGINGDGDLRGGDGIKIDHLTEGGEISRQGIDDTEETGRLRLLQGHLPVADLQEHGVSTVLDCFGRGWQGRAAGGRTEFEAVIFRRIMAGGKVDPPGRLTPQKFMGNDRGRGVAITKEDGDFGANKNFGRFAGKTIPHETGVVTDDHPAGSAIDLP